MSNTQELIKEQVAPEINDAPVCQSAVTTTSGYINHQEHSTCLKPATVQVLKTCCGAVTYTCDEHTPSRSLPPEYLGIFCRDCRHFCMKGTCNHRVILPL